MSKASQYEAARLEAERRYPARLRLKSAWSSRADFDATVSVEREERCEINLHGTRSELTLSRDDALRLAAWIMETFGESSATRGEGEA